MFLALNEENLPTIQAGVADGTLRAWRVDELGTQWFCAAVPPAIHAVADESEIFADEVEDVECEITDLGDDDDYESFDEVADDE